jgi:hypothetical protein
MKVRSGFVSNSSSSSFIAIGVKFDKLTDKQEKAIEKVGLDATWIEGSKGYYIVGEEFAHWDDCDGDCVVSVEDFQETINNVKKNLGVALPDEDVSKVSIHYGVRAS